LAGDVEFEALGDIPFPLAPNGSRKWSLHDLIVSQARVLRTAARVPSLLGHLTTPRGLCWHLACYAPRSKPESEMLGASPKATWGSFGGATLYIGRAYGAQLNCAPRTDIKNSRPL
jgi:hypothetical protein